MALTENDRWIAVEGPFKSEKVWITSDATDDDTLSSTLASPKVVSITSVNKDLAATADPASATLSGKVATLRDPAAQDYIVEFIGF